MALNPQDGNSGIPYYLEINDFLASIPSPYRTTDPLLYCLRLNPNDTGMSNYKPPFRKDFYFIGLVNNAGNTEINYDNTNVTQLNAFLVFQSPGLLYSFYRDDSAAGYLIYFKKDCLSFFKQEIEQAFPYFNILSTNFFRINHSRFQEFAPHFESVFKAYESAKDGQHTVAKAQLLTLLFQLLEFSTAFSQWQEGFQSPKHILLQKFIQLVNHHYLEKRTIEEYALQLSVTPNHLSQTIKEASGKNALSFVNERLLTEAKSLIRYTQLGMAEIAYQLNFSDPTYFGKFFRKHTGMTPLEFRKQHQ